MEQLFKEMMNNSNLNQLKTEKSQMEKLLNKSTVKVAIVDDKAYWVSNNQFYMANIDDAGRIDGENAEKVDVFSLPYKKVQSLLQILDSISD
jgi:hypothetical protein